MNPATATFEVTLFGLPSELEKVAGKNRALPFNWNADLGLPENPTQAEAV